MCIFEKSEIYNTAECGCCPAKSTCENEYKSEIDKSVIKLIKECINYNNQLEQNCSKE